MLSLYLSREQKNKDRKRKLFVYNKHTDRYIINKMKYNIVRIG